MPEQVPGVGYNYYSGFLDCCSCCYSLLLSYYYCYYCHHPSWLRTEVWRGGTIWLRGLHKGQYRGRDASGHPVTPGAARWLPRAGLLVAQGPTPSLSSGDTRGSFASREDERGQLDVRACVYVCVCRGCYTHSPLRDEFFHPEALRGQLPKCGLPARMRVAPGGMQAELRRLETCVSTW